MDYFFEILLHIAMNIEYFYDIHKKIIIKLINKEIMSFLMKWFF